MSWLLGIPIAGNEFNVSECTWIHKVILPFYWLIAKCDSTTTIPLTFSWKINLYFSRMSQCHGSKCLLKLTIDLFVSFLYCFQYNSNQPIVILLTYLWANCVCLVESFVSAGVKVHYQGGGCVSSSNISFENEQNWGYRDFDWFCYLNPNAFTVISWDLRLETYAILNRRPPHHEHHKPRSAD